MSKGYGPFLSQRLAVDKVLLLDVQVTAGGSICIESLTLSGTEGSWYPSQCVESIMVSCAAAATCCFGGGGMLIS